MFCCTSCTGTVSSQVFPFLARSQISPKRQTCRELRQAIRDRHVWIDELEKLRQEYYPVLRPATPPLTFLSAQELQTLVIARMKLRLCWKNGDDGFTAEGHAGIPGVRRIILLPGGRSLLSIDNHGGVALRRIELGDSQGSLTLPIIASCQTDQNVTFGAGRNHLLSTMSPCPIPLHSQGYM